VTFSVRSSKALVEANRATNRPELTVSLPGELFDPPLTLQRVPRQQADTRTPLGALQADWSAQLTDDEAWVIENFAAGDQADIKRWLADPKMRDANLQVLKRQGQPRVLGWAGLKRVREGSVAKGSTR
jgi:hypothetical protein